MIVYQSVRLWISCGLGVEKKLKKKNNFFWWFEMDVGIKIEMKKARKVIRSY